MTDQPKPCPECSEAPSVNGGRCIDCRGASMVDLANEGPE